MKSLYCYQCIHFINGSYCSVYKADVDFILENFKPAKAFYSMEFCYKSLLLNYYEHIQ